MSTMSPIRQALLAGIGVGICVASIEAQELPAAPPHQATYARLVGDIAPLCPLTLENGVLKVQMGRSTAAGAIAEVRECLQRQLSASEEAFSQRVTARRASIPQPCLDTLIGLRVELLAHLENFLGVGEPPSTTIRRVNDEAQRLRTNATKARLTCE